jgi:hypothetical protein
MATSVAARGWISHRRNSVAITDPFVPSYWDRRQRNPELAKALSLIQGYVGEARKTSTMQRRRFGPRRSASVYAIC